MLASCSLLMPGLRFSSELVGTTQTFTTLTANDVTHTRANSHLQVVRFQVVLHQGARADNEEQH